MGIYEIRIHGRGGQGVRMTARILGRAAFLSGLQTQDFAIYGSERRGAPLASFCRISKEAIGTRGYVFAPDFVILLDPTLDPEVVSAGLKKDGFILINSEKKLSGFAGLKTHYIDATGIAMKALGKPIPNVAVLGAFLKLTEMFPAGSLEKAIKEELEEAGHGNMVESNISASRLCWRNVK